MVRKLRHPAYSLVILLALLLAGPESHAHVSGIQSHGHQKGQTYTTLSFGTREIHLLYTVPKPLARDYAVREASEFLQVLETSLTITNLNQPCPVTWRDAADYSAIDAWQYELQFTCNDVLDTVYFGYHLFDERAFHTNQVEFRLGEHLSFIEMGYMLDEAEIPVQFILKQRGWELPETPAPLTGKVPSVLDYFVLGFQHVVTGYDHMAFLLGLMLVVERMRSLVLLITCFTVAHSLTLALSGLAITTFPVALTEAAIAFTIIYIGLENLWYLHRQKQTPGAGHTLQRRWVTTFAFGLIHGFGFSFILREIGLSQEEFVPALLLFNLGVEAGQLTAVVVPFLIIRHFIMTLPLWRATSIALSIGISLLGTWWLIERTVPY